MQRSHAAPILFSLLSVAPLAFLHCSASGTPDEGGAPSDTSSAGSSGATPNTADTGGGGVSSSTGTSSNGPPTRSPAGDMGSATAGSSGGGFATAGAAGDVGAQGGSAAALSGGFAGASGAPGAAGGAGSRDDSCAGHLVCDHFENDMLGAAPKAPWQTTMNKGKVAIDDTHAHSGKYSVKVSTEAGQYKQALFFVQGAPAFPITNNTVYGRMMIYMDQTANDGVHWTMIVGSGPLSGHTGVTSFYRYGGMWKGQMMANYETNGAHTDCWDNSQTKMPTGQWACMEWRFSGPTNEMSFWLDGQEVSDMHVKDKGQGCGKHDLNDQWLAPSFDKMSFGWESYQQDDARTAWIDDVVIDDKAIGCPSP